MSTRQSVAAQGNPPPKDIECPNCEEIHLHFPLKVFEEEMGEVTGRYWMCQQCQNWLLVLVETKES